MMCFISVIYLFEDYFQRGCKFKAKGQQLVVTICTLTIRIVSIGIELSKLKLRHSELSMDKICSRNINVRIDMTIFVPLCGINTSGQADKLAKKALAHHGFTHLSYVQLVHESQSVTPKLHLGYVTYIYRILFLKRNSFKSSKL